MCAACPLAASATGPKRFSSCQQIRRPIEPENKKKRFCRRIEPVTCNYHSLREDANPKKKKKRKCKEDGYGPLRGDTM